MLPAKALLELSQGVKSSKYVTSTCCSPVYRRVRLSEDGSYQDMYCDCGHCMVCTDRKRNEMAARMFLHAVDYAYCYFVTLTYGSYNLLPFKKHPFLEDWMQTIPTYDTHNDSSQLRWTPTILVKSHIQKFHKRLNKLVGSYTHCSCGEYGETHGRPHYHTILFSNRPISVEEVQDAWSLECKRTNDKYTIRPWRGDTIKCAENGYFKFRIGQVKFYDLWKNGSLNYDGQHPGAFNDGHKAMNNFTYVAKYLGKNDPYTCYAKLPSWVTERINYAYKVLSNDIDSLGQDYPVPYLYQLKVKQFISLHYDYHDYEKISIIDFKKMVAPFFLSSRRPAIGKQYFLKNCARFQAKGFSLPKFMGKEISFPSYYFRLLSQKDYPIRIRKNVDSGISHTKDLLPRVYEYFSLLRQDANFWFSVRSLPHGKKEDELEHTYNRNGVYLYSLTGNDKDGEVDHIDFVDPFNNTIHFVYNPYDEIFRGYVYNRHTRSYDLYENFYDREEFCDLVLQEIEDELKDLPDKKYKMQLAFDLENAILSDDEASAYRENYIKLRQELDLKYQSQKLVQL